jgi:hypothetical protein
VDQLEVLGSVLDGAALLGLELEPRYRVLAATLEPTSERYAQAWPGDVADRRIQLLCFPVSTLLVSLRRHEGGRAVLQTFDIEQLLDVVVALDGARVHAPLFGLPEPRPGQWGPRFSAQGRSSAPDGTRRTLTLSPRTEDLALNVFARFDDLELKDPSGQPLRVGRAPG